VFASIRSYVLQRAPVIGAPTGEFARLVEAEFADQIASHPGFVWYAFLECGGGDVMTISVFQERDQALASRELARRWVDERVSELDLSLTEALDGEIPVSRVAPALLEPARGRFARVRRYKVSDADLSEFGWRIVDTRLAERMAKLHRFVAYFVFGSRTGELVTVSVFQDRAASSGSDELAMAFVRYNLDHLDVERTDMIGGGEIVVSRVSAPFLEPRRLQHRPSASGDPPT
jgi:hypothetical protein